MRALIGRAGVIRKVLLRIATAWVENSERHETARGVCLRAATVG
jgi:hypothetical protein